jgi:hypothetical protein
MSANGIATAGRPRKTCLSTNAFGTPRPNIYYCAATLNNRCVLLKASTQATINRVPGADSQHEWQDMTRAATQSAT